MTSKKLTRLNFIDVARSYAIILALFSHAMLAFGGFAALGEDALKIKLFTRTATPLFVFMFGMMLAIPIIWLRCRAGPISLVIMLIAIWVGDIFLERYAGISLGQFDALTGILFGTGSTLDGPSVWHGMTFVFAGMLVAASLHNWKEAGLKQFYYTLFALTAVSLTVVAYLATDVSLTGVIKRFANYNYRSHNHIGYYAVGLIACAITLFILSRIIPLHGKMPGWTRIPLAFSRSSLLSYSPGNIFLSLLPAAAASQSVSRAVLSSVLFLIVLMLLMNSRYIEDWYRKASLIRFEPGMGKGLLRSPDSS